MDVIDNFFNHLNPQQRYLISSLKNPHAIQEYLDSIQYSPEDTNRSPLGVIIDGKAHCLDGAFFAAAALRCLGYPPLVIDLLPVQARDDDHVLAIFKQGSLIGAVAKSNYTGLRFREPVYRSLRELVMSYFEVFFNVEAEKTLRYYTRPMNLKQYDHLGWMWDDEHLNVIEKRLYSLRRIPVIDETTAQTLSPVDRRSYDAGMLGVNEAGLYRPG
jgi:hypothetical protein